MKQQPKKKIKQLDLKKSFKFKLPGLPPSVNQMYKINYRTRQCYLDESVRNFKNKAISYIPPIDLQDGCKLEVNVTYYGKFFNKNGTIKRRDGQNLDKCLYDVIFEKLGLDDKHAFKGSWEKVHSEEEFTLVEINVL